MRVKRWILQEKHGAAMRYCDTYSTCAKPQKVATTSTSVSSKRRGNSNRPLEGSLGLAPIRSEKGYSGAMVSSEASPRLKVSIRVVLFLVALLTLASVEALFTLVHVRADGFIDFENGVDGTPIRSTIPGLQFTTTAGYDWIYGDWRTRRYNGPYPRGKYYSNGNFFAWLGPNQGAGRIDFTQGCATYLQVWVSSAYGLHADAYYSDGGLAATAYVSGNLDTGRMARLRVDAPPGRCFSYVLLHDTGNFWLIDDLSTDAGGVPATRPSVVVIPGLMGSKLRNNDRCANTDSELWPNVAELIRSWNDEHLRPLILKPNGSEPESSCDQIYNAGVIREISLGPATVKQVYGPLIEYLQTVGFEVYPFDYDWRLDLRQTADRLDEFIDRVVNETGRVSIVDHSLGGLLARYYVTSSPTRAAKVEQVISIGTPFLGAPKALKLIRWGDPLPVNFLWLELGLLNPERSKEIAQNSPVAYQILPSARYFLVNGGGYYRVEGRVLDENATRQVIRQEHNASLLISAEQFHSDSMDDWNRTPLPVAFRLIVGTGREETPGRIHERTVLDWLGRQRVVVDIEPTNGDGTVPVHSASLQGHGYDFSGRVPIWYADDLKHDELVIERYVVEFVGALLATPPNAQALLRAQPAKQMTVSSAMALYQGPVGNFTMARHAETLPPTPPEMSEIPFGVDGAQVTSLGAVALHVYDQAGHHTGVTLTGLVEVGIPGSSYTVVGNSTIVTLPSGGAYRIRANSLGDEFVNLRIRDLQGTSTHLIQRTISFMDVSFLGNTVAELHYVPNRPSDVPILVLDIDGNGDPDEFINPTTDVGQSESADMTPPTLEVQIEGALNPSGWYIGEVRINIEAGDADSGVAKVVYTVDGGREVLTYTGPFVVQAERVSEIVIKVIDRAGNETWKKVMIGPIRTYLPSLEASIWESGNQTWRNGYGTHNRIVYNLSSTDTTCTTLFAATDNGAYRSTDAGQSWTPVPTFSAQTAFAPKVFDGIEAPSAALTPAVAVCPANPNIVYLTQWGGGVYRSGDGGVTWQPRNAGLGDLWIYALAVHPSNCDVVYVAANERGVWQTTDGGASWSPRNSGLGNLATRSIAMAPSNPNRVYVGTTAGIWRTDNGGTAWTATSGLPAAPARSLAVSRTNSDFVVAALDGAGVFITTNAGSSWQERNNGLPDRGARAVALDPRNSQRVVVGLGYGGGVYTSDNGGSAWTAMNEGLGNRNVKALWQAGGACRRLYAGTTNGVWFTEP